MSKPGEVVIPAEVILMLRRLHKLGLSCGQIAKQLGMSKGHVARVIRGEARRGVV